MTMRSGDGPGRTFAAAAMVGVSLAVAGLVITRLAVAADAPPRRPTTRPAATRPAATRPQADVGSAKSGPARAGPVKTGHQTLTFADRSPLSANKVMTDRLGWVQGVVRGPDYKADYRLADETFDAYVPDGYTGDRPFGLVVFVSPGPAGGLGPIDARRGWKAEIDRHELIWVGPNNVGNSRPTLPRLGLAIDAAVNAQARFRVDPDRVYVMGVSGGGRVASMLGVAFADVFRGGGAYIIGCDFYKRERSREQPGSFAQTYFTPPKQVLDPAKRRSKHVFVTGDTDGNRDQTQTYFAAFRREGFEHCTYLQVPGVGHEPPPQEWFAKAMAALDERLPPVPPLPGPKTKPAAPPPTKVPAKR